MYLAEVVLADNFGKGLDGVEYLEAEVEGRAHLGGEYPGFWDDDVEDVVVLVGV